MDQTAPIRRAHIRPPRPRTEKQREASRRNGARSLGPSTSRGRQISSRNSLRHGIHSKSGPPISPETAEIMALIREDCLAQFSPRTAEEQAKVETLAALTAALHLLAETETKLWNEEIARQRALDPGKSPEMLLARAGEKLCAKSRALETLLRLQTRLERRVERLRDALQAIETAPAAEKIKSDKTNPATATKQTTGAGNRPSQPARDVRKWPKTRGSEPTFLCHLANGPPGLPRAA